MHDAFAEERLLVERQHGRVGEDVIDERRPGGAGKPHIADLDRGGAMGQHPWPAAAGQAVEIDRDVDVEIMEQAGDVPVAIRRHIMEPIERPRDAQPRVARIVRTIRHADHLEPRMVVTLEQFDDGKAHRVLAKVRRHVSDAQLFGIVLGPMRKRTPCDWGKKPYAGFGCL